MYTFQIEHALNKFTRSIIYYYSSLDNKSKNYDNWYTNLSKENINRTKLKLVN